MKTSAQGVAAIEHHEGVVLKAYRDVVGVWTIGAGLTAASGVVKPKAGMVISRADATKLLQVALNENYEPAVLAQMADAAQHEFDAGVSFHFNTGAIARATWVKLWRADAARSAVRGSLMQWTKGGGKVLPGLVRRRDDEARMLLEGKYPVAAAPKPPVAAVDGWATWALAMTQAEREAVGKALQDLSYQPFGDADAGAWIRAAAVRAFQKDHGLTVDGIIGRATLSTLQRRLDAATKTKATAAATTVAVPAAALGPDVMPLDMPGAAEALAGAPVLYALYLAFTYRDAVAAVIQQPLPRLAAFLRSF